MPTYQFKDKKTGRKWVATMTISSMEGLLRDDPLLDVIPGKPLVHSGRGLGKPEQGFRDLLKDIKSKHYKSNINTF